VSATRGPSAWGGTLVVGGRELREVLHNRQVLIQYGVFGALMPVFFGYTLGDTSGLSPVPESFSPVRIFLAQVAIMPFIGALQGIVQAFAGERADRTLAPLLATPLPNLSIFGGKVLASYLPSLAVSWFGMATLVSTVAVRGDRARAGLSNGLILQVAVLAVVTGLAVVIAGVIASSRASSVKSAQAASGMLMMPIVVAVLLLAGRLSAAPGRVLTGCILSLVPLGWLLVLVARRWRREEAILLGSTQQ
jgi:ABC-2 type transport system permease protein